MGVIARCASCRRCVMSTEPMFGLSVSQRFHAGAAEMFDAIAAPADCAGVAAAQAECLRVWESRGSYGCERHLFVAAMSRVSRVLFVVGVS